MTAGCLWTVNGAIIFKLRNNCMRYLPLPVGPGKQFLAPNAIRKGSFSHANTRWSVQCGEILPSRRNFNTILTHMLPPS